MQNSGKDHRGAAGPDTEVSVIGIRYISGRRAVMCNRPGSGFRTSLLLYADEKG